MSRGIRNKGDIFVCLNRIWSKKVYRFPMANYRYPMQKLTSVLTHYSESQKSTKGIDRDQIPSKANFSEKILCIRYTEFLTNGIAESSTGLYVAQREGRGKYLVSALRMNLEHL